MATAVVVGSGPNGLVAALTLARAGWTVTVLEAAATPGGGTRSAALTVPGAIHDVCSAIHPLAVGSPAFRELDDAGVLARHGLQWIHAPVPLAHPLDGGRAAILHRSVTETAAGLGADGAAYRRMFAPLVDAGYDLTDGLLSPLQLPPQHPIELARFGVRGLAPADLLARRAFDGDDARALFAGLAAHSVLSLRQPITAGYGLMLGTLAHVVGWPMARGGSQAIADALVGALADHGGTVVCDEEVGSLADVPSADAVLFDVTPRQLLAIAGDALPSRYRRTLTRYRHGPGVFKIDYALDGPIPWSDGRCGDAGTVHLGGTLDEIVAGEGEVQRGRHPERPYVLLAQQSRFDPSRVPAGVETVWAYAHVPNGSTIDMSGRIESQIERFAPGFRDRIVARSTMHAADFGRYDANYVGGDINGGAGDLRQFVARPRLGLRPWKIPLPGMYLCSSSTPPGGGVHGMCGWHAAHEVLRDRRRR